jgi:hypothetical protein
MTSAMPSNLPIALEAFAKIPAKGIRLSGGSGGNAGGRKAW